MNSTVDVWSTFVCFQQQHIDSLRDVLIFVQHVAKPQSRRAVEVGVF